MNFAVAVLDVEFSTARQQPAIVVMVNVDLSAIGNMDREGAKRLGAETVSDFVGQHDRDANQRKRRGKAGIE